MKKLPNIDLQEAIAKSSIFNSCEGINGDLPTEVSISTFEKFLKYTLEKYGEKNFKDKSPNIYGTMPDFFAFIPVVLIGEIRDIPRFIFWQDYPAFDFLYPNEMGCISNFRVIVTDKIRGELNKSLNGMTVFSIVVMNEFAEDSGDCCIIRCTQR